MVIDIFTVIAQIINFLILVYLLKRFLFNRIINIMDERENQIKERFEKAEEQQSAAEKELEKQREMKEKLEQEWDDKLAEINEEIKSKREEMMENAKNSVDKARQNWQEAINKQRSSFLREMKKLSSQQIWKVSRKVLSDLADENLEKQLVNSFLEQLENIQQNEKDLLSALKGEQNITIYSQFELSKEDRNRIIDKVQSLTEKKNKIAFKESNDLISGIELKTEGKKITWSIQSYLDMMERNFQEYFDERITKKMDSKENSAEEGKNGKESQ